MSERDLDALIASLRDHGWHGAIDAITALRARVEHNLRDGNFLDPLGCCKVCDGEIPYGHTENCDILKLERERDDLRARAEQAEADGGKLLWALRALVISTELDFESRCGLCGERWPNPQFERHAEGCLAAPAIDRARSQGEGTTE